MATILLNGVVTDASSISGSELSDKLTVSGGVDGLSVDLDAGDDLVEIYAASEDVTDTEIRVSEGDDTIVVVAQDGTNNNNTNDGDDFAGLPISLGDSLLAGPGDDRIIIDDGLVQLAGAVKGNEGDDFLDISNINGGTVNGNAGEDIILIGDTGGLANGPGERGEAAVTNGSVMGGQADDTITVNAAVTGSAIRGNEGDDNINLAGSTFSGATTVNGNAGDDFIDASGAESAFTVNGGQGDDQIRAGNGQTVRGGRGADTFVVAASGGITIDDYDRLDADCFCDDTIIVENIEFETHNYAVNVDLFTSASSWTGDIKVKAVADDVATGEVVTAKLTRTKTETISAMAVARLLITETAVAGKEATAKSALESATYPRNGQTFSGDTFKNGNATAGPGTTRVGGVDDLRQGLGEAFGSNSGVWLRDQNVNPLLVTGFAKSFSVATFNQFAKGDFSFLGLTATAKIGVTTGQKLIFDDVTQATIKNHHAEYTKVKTTTTVGLQQLDFGTANFREITTGKAFMVITDLEDRAYKTVTLDDAAAIATAKATLNLDNTFSAWKGNPAGTGTTATDGLGNNIGDFTRLSNAAGGTKLTWDTLLSRGFATVSTTAKYAAASGSPLFTNQITVGKNNTNISRDDFITRTAKLTLKIKASTTAQATAKAGIDGLIQRTTITGQDLGVTTCPAFPTAVSLATRQTTPNRNAQSGEVVGTFNQMFVWNNEANALGGITNAIFASSVLNTDSEAAGNGFFSGTAFNVANMEDAGFGANAVAEASANAQDVPFRVLFFDNDEADNGLYVISGMADYNNGVLTGLNTAPMATSAMGGKHTIVKVADGKGHAIELNDINFV